MTTNQSEHEQLRDLWIKQNQRIKDLRMELFRGVNTVVQTFQRTLGVDEYWVDPTTNEQHRYVEIINLDNKSKMNKLDLMNGPLTDDGVLTVGIGITLDREQKAFPKSVVCVPVALRLIQGKLQVNWWNMEAQALDNRSGWMEDIQELCNETIKVIKENLKHDPLDGFPSKSSRIGFI